MDFAVVNKSHTKYEQKTRLVSDKEGTKERQRTPSTGTPHNSLALLLVLINYMKQLISATLDGANASFRLTETEFPIPMDFISHKNARQG